ncbi:hypothetical protein C6503_03470 [Candidatus Poribacteria bacterium]|nr:MAG: hypothetical protein C6503_03470 [Candidatus Poribacteria bacterium]
MPRKLILFVSIWMCLFAYNRADAQQPLARQAYAIFEQHCLNCHGPHGAFTEQIVIDSAAGLIASGAVVPGKPIASELYKRLLTNDPAKRMPFGQPALSATAILTIGNWIQAGAPNWDVQHDVNFITPHAMLTAIENHLSTLDTFNRPFARYFTMTHLYNAGERPETLRAYRVALSKLVNSLSWGYEVIPPKPIDAQATIFYIDLRDYEWDVRGDAWKQIEAVYPYAIEFDAQKQRALLGKLTTLRQQTNSQVPYVYADWFLATASLPPLYHEILDLPETDLELERDLGINVARNLSTAPGVRVWRAGFNDSGVSNHNRVVERHKSPHGAYWKSYDFAGSAGVQNIFTHPLSFRADGGEVVFNLPNGLQAYYISNASGQRIDVAPTEIVSNPAASDPAVHNGLSCIGCHTEGMKTFEDTVRAAVQQTANPPFDKAHALRLYVPQTQMDALVAEDTQRYRKALEATGGVFGGIEPVHRFYEAFQGPVDAEHAAASVGLERDTFLKAIREKSSLQNLGLTPLVSGGNVKRDAWTDRFSEVIRALNSPDTPVPSVVVRPVRPIPGGTVHIPDANLRRVIQASLGKTLGAVITSEEMARLTHMSADDSDIRSLIGLEYAEGLKRIELRHNAISDLSPLAGLKQLEDIKLRGNAITDVSPLAGLVNVHWLGLEENQITDLSPLSGLTKLNGIGIDHNPVSDIRPLASMRSLEGVSAFDTSISDLSPLSVLPRLSWINISNKSLSKLPSFKGFKNLRVLRIEDTSISDISGLAELTTLRELSLRGNAISDVSPLAKLTGLRALNLSGNLITDFSPLEGFSEKTVLNLSENPGFPQGGPKIMGPWLWMLFPEVNFEEFANQDLLARASGGRVTEVGVATDGAKVGDAIGERLWTSLKLPERSWDNLRPIATAIDRSVGADTSSLLYGSVVLDSPRQQKTTMFAGSDDRHKVWLNGTLVNEDTGGALHDYETFFPVTLTRGKNVVLVAVYDYWGGFNGSFGFAPDAEYTVVPTNNHFALSTATSHLDVGDSFVVHFKAENISDLAGWQADLVFDPLVLTANTLAEGTFLKQKGGRTYFEKGTLKKGGKIAGIQSLRVSEGGIAGTGTLLSVRFRAKAVGSTRISLRNFVAGSSTGQTIPASPTELYIVVGGKRLSPAWDVNEDGITDATDVALVTTALGKPAAQHPRADVNADSVIDGKDIAIVAEHLGERNDAAAPFADPQSIGLIPENVEDALEALRAADDGSLTFRRAIGNLEVLLAAFVPEATVLLANYPNPFNPETWIPYELATPETVRIDIYAADGVWVRRLDLGHQPAGIYRYRSRAAYWDGRNAVGEPVASGVYFYTLTTGDFTATRKMLIRK